MIPNNKFFIRKSFEDKASQKGVYNTLRAVKNAFLKLSEADQKEYKVFDVLGNTIYPSKNIIKNANGEPINNPLEIKYPINKDVADDKVIWDYFKSKGLNDYGIAGLMGNLYAESGLKPCNLQNSFNTSLDMTDEEYTIRVDNGSYTNFVKDGAGYGLAQWTFWSLKQDLLNYCQEKKKSISDLKTQLDFLTQQLQNNYSSVWNTMKNAKTILEASNAMLLNFERPADQGTAVQNERASYGKVYFDKYKTVEEVITPTQTPVVSKLKYNDSNKPIVCMQTTSTCYQGTRTMDVKGILWHSTGVNNDSISRYVQPSDNDPNRAELLKVIGRNSYGNDWNHIYVEAGLNCWIGRLADDSVATVQTMPWNYRPWGCGSGSRGSCNSGWIQFEICEDSLANRDYFEKVYKEGVEITAYLCKMFNLNPKGTVSYCGATVPVILCHHDSYELGLGSGHADVLHWFGKYGKTMDDVRNDVAKLLNGDTSSATPGTTELYRVRKSWEDAKSQIGAFANLEGAKKACDTAGSEYKVFNSSGVAIYPESAVPSQPKSFAKGQKVKLVSGATYADGSDIPSWLMGYTLYVRDIYNNGNIVISTVPKGAVTGVVEPKYLVDADSASTGSTAFTPYVVIVTANALNVRSGAGSSYSITTQVHKNELYTIVGEQSGWGKLKSGAGWLDLQYTERYEG